MVIKFANYRDLCPFSKTLILHNNVICLFNKKQYNAFVKTIKDILNNWLFDDLIELIIEKTKYKKYIGRFGHQAFTYWTSPHISYIRKKSFVNMSDSDTSDTDTSDTDISDTDTTIII